MARNRKNQPAAIRFGPAVRALLLCLLFGGAGVGYVWQKTQIYELGQQIRKKEMRLTELQDLNKKQHNHLAFLQLPARLDQRARELGLGQPLPANVWRLPEPLPVLPRGAGPTGQYAAHQNSDPAMP